jgi:hypothetical protein
MYTPKMDRISIRFDLIRPKDGWGDRSQWPTHKRDKCEVLTRLAFVRVYQSTAEYILYLQNAIEIWYSSRF